MSTPDSLAMAPKSSRRRFLELSATGATLVAGIPLAAERSAVAQQTSQSGPTPSDKRS